MKTRDKLLIAGGIAGALLGVAAAFLYIKANESQISSADAGEAGATNNVSPGEAMSVGLSLLSVLRQIANLGQG